MGVGVSLLLLVAGAILTIAIDPTGSNVNLDLIGIILLVIGGVGLVLSLVAATSRRRDEHQVVERRNYSSSHPARGSAQHPARGSADDQ